MSKLKQGALWLMIVFYIFAGLNHFVHPEFYFPLIPPYFPWPNVINIMSGLAEVLLGTSLIFNATRKRGAYGIIVMLIAFIPAHIYFIQMNSCVSETLCTREAIGWIRLIVIHPLLLTWAWWVKE